MNAAAHYFDEHFVDTLKLPAIGSQKPLEGARVRPMNYQQHRIYSLGVGAVAFAFVTILGGQSNFGALVTIPAQNRASGVSWNLVWSNPNQEGHLGVGGSVAGQTGQTSTLLRFDVTGLKDAYETINSVTIRLTQGSTSWSQSFERFGGTIQVYRLKAENAGWNDNATFGYPDKTVDVTWAGGESGAMVPDIDHDGVLLATADYAGSPEGAEVTGIIYDLVIPGDLAEPFIEEWASGEPNAGFVLFADASPEGDNRLFLVPDGENGPKLIIDYQPKAGLAAIGVQPNSVSVNEGAAAVFSVMATGAPPLSYQWLKGGQPIEGATGADYSIDRVELQDNQARFAVVVTDAAGSSVTSNEAVLTVVPDTTGPTVLSATGIDITTVRIRFSEPVTAATAENKDNYQIGGNITVESARLEDDSTVLLTTSTQTLKASNTLTINGVADRSAAGNQVAAGTQAVFTTPTPRVALPLQHRASGVSWNLVFSNPNEEGHLAVGYAGATSRTSTQLRFDVRPLGGVYDEINSVTIRLTHGFTSWSIGRAMGEGILYVHRLSDANADWTDSGTFGLRDGTNQWAGGESGALVAETDYDPTVLAQLEYENNPTGLEDPVGRVYDVVIPGNLATPLIEDWISGGVNEGFLLRAEPAAPGGDTRLLLFHAGTNAPQLIVDYTPKAGLLAITDDLDDISVGQGDPVTFTVGARGAPPLRYQWYRNGTSIEGATGRELTIESAQNTDAGALFSVEITDATNSKVTSREAKLTVTGAVPRMVFEAQNRASGVQWAPGFSNANDEGHLAVGSRAGENQNTSTQLRFDVTPLNGLYEAINSATIRLTQGTTAWSSAFTRNGGTIEVYRLTDANADWNNLATFGTKDGTQPWAGGESGALTPGEDYMETLLASAPYETILQDAPHVATVYDLVIPGELAGPILDQWASGGINEGFLLRSPAGQGDNRSLFVPEGADGPKLIVDYTPKGGERPTLQISQEGNELTLSWTGEGFVLQQSPNIADPGGWTDVPGGNVTPFRVTPAATGNSFYRLVRP